MHNLKKVQQNYVELKNDYEAKKESAEKKIVRLQKKINKLNNNYPYWTENLLLPILNEVKALTPQLTWDFKRLTPMGMRSAVFVFGSDKDGNTIVGLCFTPGDLDNGIVHIDTGETEGNYSKNSIGNLNGFNNLTTPVESFDDIMNIVNAQIKKTEGCFFYKNMRLKPVRMFNKKEVKLRENNDIIRGMTCIGVSNYTERNDSITDYSHEEFYATAKAKSDECYNAEIFLLNDCKYVVPFANELFEYVDFEKNS